MAIGQPIERRLPVARVATAALPGDLDEPQRHKFADCGRNRVPVQPVLDEMLMRAGEPAVLFRLAAMLMKLDLESRQDPMRR